MVDVGSLESGRDVDMHGRTLSTIMEIVTAFWHVKATGGRKTFMTFPKKGGLGYDIVRVVSRCQAIFRVRSAEFQVLSLCPWWVCLLNFFEIPLHLRFLGEASGGASRGGKGLERVSAGGVGG